MRSARWHRLPPTRRVSLPASSSSTDRVLVGRIGRPHGLHGYVAVHPDTDNPDRYSPGRVMSTDSGTTLTVERSQQRSGSLLVRFEGVVDRTGAEALAGERLFIDAAERRPLEPEEYWPEDLIGLEARSADGRFLGRVESVIEGAAQYRILIHGASGSFEVPFVEELVPEVDLSSGFVVIVTIDGLVPEN